MILLLLGDSDFGRVQLRQIRAAMADGTLAEQQLVVVGERAPALRGDPAAEGATLHEEPAGAYLLRNLGDLPGDCRVIPAPIGPHVFAGLLAEGSGGRLTAPEANFRLPFVRRQAEAVYLSAAAWTCPVTCMAPAVCPRIALRRNWHLPSLLRRWAREQGMPAIVFAPRGPSSGAEGVSAQRLQAALRRVQRGGPFLVATAAPCHAAASLLHVG